MRCRTLQGFEVLIVACLKCLKVEGAITYKLQILVKNHGISKFIRNKKNTIVELCFDNILLKRIFKFECRIKKQFGESFFKNDDFPIMGWQIVTYMSNCYLFFIPISSSLAQIF